MYHTLLVAIGGLVGAVARYWLASWAQNANGSVFPVGTLTVNVLGSFVLGVVMTLSLERALISPEVRILLSVGFCGGFTTMSTFSYETLVLLQYGYGIAGLANIGLSMGACLTAVWLGALVGRLF